jgi:hypothetical protein
MNKKLITSTAALALLLSTGLPALAHADNGSDDSVEVSASVTHEDREGKGGFRFLGLPEFKPMASSTLRTKLGDKLQHVIDVKASSTQKHIEKVGDKAGNSIDARIASLEKLAARIADNKFLSAETLATMQASLNAEIQALKDLKVKVGSDTATTTLKGDLKSLKEGARVFLLVEPKARIAAAASRVNAVVTQMTDLSAKLQERVTAAQTAGIDVSAAVTAMTDLTAKLADAKVQADAAVSLTANLQADNGDKTVRTANMSALKDARAKLVAAEKDLAAARHDAATIYSVVKGTK